MFGVTVENNVTSPSFGGFCIEALALFGPLRIERKNIEGGVELCIPERFGLIPYIA